jgi:ribonuclease III
MKADAAALEAALGYEFRNREPLIRALTHRSRAYEQSTPGEDQNHNEQFEFLGDAIFGFIVSDVLVWPFPLLPRRSAHQTAGATGERGHLYTVAQELGLGGILLLGRGEEMTGGRLKSALLSDAVEAVIAAVYLDGGYRCSAGGGGTVRGGRSRVAGFRRSRG